MNNNLVIDLISELEGIVTANFFCAKKMARYEIKNELYILIIENANVPIASSIEEYKKVLLQMFYSKFSYEKVDCEHEWEELDEENTATKYRVLDSITEYRNMTRILNYIMDNVSLTSGELKVLKNYMDAKELTLEENYILNSAISKIQSSEIASVLLEFSNSRDLETLSQELEERKRFKELVSNAKYVVYRSMYGRYGERVNDKNDKFVMKKLKKEYEKAIKKLESSDSSKLRKDKAHTLGLI